LFDLLKQNNEGNDLEMQKGKGCRNPKLHSWKICSRRPRTRKYTQYFSACVSCFPQANGSTLIMVFPTQLKMQWPTCL